MWKNRSNLMYDDRTFTKPRWGRWLVAVALLTGLAATAAAVENDANSLEAVAIETD
jgi:hypothetical protein